MSINKREFDRICRKAIAEYRQLANSHYVTTVGWGGDISGALKSIDGNETFGGYHFIAAPHVRTGEYGVGPVGLTAYENDDPRHWALIFLADPNDPYNDPFPFREPGDDAGDVEMVFQGNRSVAAVELSRLIDTRFWMQPGANYTLVPLDARATEEAV